MYPQVRRLRIAQRGESSSRARTNSKRKWGFESKVLNLNRIRISNDMSVCPSYRPHGSGQLRKFGGQGHGPDLASNHGGQSPSSTAKVGKA